MIGLLHLPRCNSIILEDPFLFNC